MSESTVTTAWKSAFSYDNVDRSYHDIFTYDYNVVFRSGKDFYCISSYGPFSFEGDYVLASYDSTAMVYNTQTGFWESITLDRPAHFDSPQIIAQNLDQTQETFYALSDLRAGQFPAPSGTYFDGIYVDSVLSEVVGTFPVVLPVFVFYLALRTGISYLFGFVKGG